jgi:hypothetical protein
MSSPSRPIGADATVARTFLEYSHSKLVGEYWPRLRGCVESLTDEQAWWRPNAATNSVGNIILHLDGNVRQWLVAPFTGAIDTRDRPAEFSQREQIPRSVLMGKLGATIDEAARILRLLSASDLLETREIQGYTVTGLEAVYQVVEHFGMHYGQVVFVTKQLRGKDLGFYSDLDETGRAE